MCAIAFAGKESCDATTPNDHSVADSLRRVQIVAVEAGNRVLELRDISQQDRCLAAQDPERRTGLRERAEARNRAWQAGNHPNAGATKNGRADLLPGQRPDWRRATSGTDLLDAQRDRVGVGQQM